MWHQSDLQNRRGGAINHIGSGINHCVEDIFCHRCPLTITLCKNACSLPPSLLPTALLFLHSRSDPPIGLERTPAQRDVLSPHSFEMQVKVYGVACVPAIRNALQRREKQTTMRTLFLRLASRPLFISQPLTPRRHHYDNCHCSFSVLTIGTRVIARKVEEDERGALDLLYDRQWGSNQPSIECQHKVGVRIKALHFKGSCRRFRDADLGAIVFTVDLNLPLRSCRVLHCDTPVKDYSAFNSCHAISAA